MSLWRDALRAALGGPGPGYQADTDDEDEVDDEPAVGTGMWSSNGYWVCSHFGCAKKVNDRIEDHHCCGRCSQGREHLREALDAPYDGPGTFWHTYAGTVLNPGVCAVCSEPEEGHPVRQW